MLSAVHTSPIVCLFFLPQVICSRKNKTQDVKQKISDFLEGKDTHWYFLQEPFVPVCNPPFPEEARLNGISVYHPVSSAVCFRCLFPWLKTENIIQPAEVLRADVTESESLTLGIVES